MTFAEKGELPLIFRTDRVRRQNAYKTQFLLLDGSGICHWNGVLMTVDNVDGDV